MLRDFCIFNLFLMLIILLITLKLSAQENQQTSPEFPIGAVISANPAIYDKVDESGINYMQGTFTSFTQNSQVKLLGGDIRLPDAYISKYAMGYYTRWQAERDTFANLETGLKHPGEDGYTDGRVEYYDGAYCWATDSSAGEVVDSLIWGPNYKQDKKYKWNEFEGDLIPYITNFRLALNSEELPDTTAICRLSVYYEYKYIIDSDTTICDTTFTDRILRFSDFPDGTFRNFELDYNYPGNLAGDAPRDLPGYLYPEVDTLIIDADPETGIEFRIDFFGKGKLYTDWIEVYDQNIWGDYMNNPDSVAYNIKSFANNHASWNSLEYWLAYEEPNTIDSYTPFRIVDSLLQNDPGIGKHKPLATVIYPDWSGQVNGDDHLKKFVLMANPTKLMIDRYTFWTSRGTDEGLWSLKNSLRDADLAQPGFWYYAQAFGTRLDDSTGEYCY